MSEINEPHRIPLFPRTDLTIERLQYGLELVARRVGLSSDELWSTVADAELAKYQRQSAEDMLRRELIVKNREWVIEFGDRPLKGLLVMFEAGGVPTPSEKIVCGQCKENLLTGEAGARFITARFLNRQTSISSKDELFRHIRSYIADGKASTYITCPKCGNTTANFRMIPAPGK